MDVTLALAPRWQVHSYAELVGAATVPVLPVSGLTEELVSTPALPTAPCNSKLCSPFRSGLCRSFRGSEWRGLWFLCAAVTRKHRCPWCPDHPNLSKH